MKVLAGLGDRIQRYPVLFFGAVGKFIQAKAHIASGTPDDLWLTAFLLWLQSAYSVSKKTAEERVDAAAEDVKDKLEQAKYVGAVEQQATMAAHEAIKNAPAKRPLRPQT